MTGGETAKGPSMSGTTGATGGSTGASSLFQLTDDGRDAVLVVRDQEGYLSSAVLAHQEALLTRCMEELCGQVATLCVERGACAALQGRGLLAGAPWQGGWLSMKKPMSPTAWAWAQSWRQLCMNLIVGGQEVRSHRVFMFPMLPMRTYAGHLMWQLWVALRHMLRLALNDREMSRWVVGTCVRWGV